MRYHKYAAVFIVSIVYLLLSAATVVLGEPVPQTGQAQVEADPSPISPVSSLTEAGVASAVGPTAQAVETPTEQEAEEPVTIKPEAPPPTSPPAQEVKAPAKPPAKDDKPAAKEPAPAPKKDPESPPAAREPDAKPAVKQTAPKKAEPPAKPKPAPKDLAKANVSELKQTHPGLISRIISMTKGLVSRAISWLGTRYIWGGISRRGVDCSGLTSLLYKSEGVDLPHSAKAQYKLGRPVPKISLLPGDLVFFNTRGPVSHVGLYIGNGQFVHAANPKRGVRVDSLGSSYYNNRYAGARRYKDFG